MPPVPPRPDASRAAVGAAIATLSPEAIAQLKDRLRECLPADDSGRITYAARANAVRGRVPRALRA